MAKKEEDKGKETEDEEIVMVGPGAEDEEQSEETTDEGVEASEEGEEGEERTGHTEDDGRVTPERQAIRERRRAERKDRKKRYHQEQTELGFLRDRNEVLERRFSEVEARTGQNEVLAIDSRIAEVKGQIATAEDLFGKAIEKNAGADASEASRIKDQLKDQLYQLEMAKSGVVQNIEQTRRGGGGGQRIDPRVVARAQQWIAENDDWFDPKLRDEDSFLAKAIEDRLYQEGRLDPKTDAYWEEYERRLAKRLPHLGLGGDEKGGGDDKGGGKGKKGGNGASGGPRFATGGRERRLGKNEVYISPERKDALIKAGVWDDPELRERYLRRYQQYDRENGAQRSRH